MKRVSYGGRLALVLRETALVATTAGPAVALRILRSRLYRVSESLLYEKPAPFLPPLLPEGVHIARIEPDEAEERSQEVAAAGAGADILNFQRGAVCFVAWERGQPAGVGWRFSESLLLKRLNLDAKGVYLGGFVVRPEFRGRGIYPMLLQAICSGSLRPEQSALVETRPENLASRRGLEKAGFSVKGRVRLRSAAGLILSCRLTVA